MVAVYNQINNINFINQQPSHPKNLVIDKADDTDFQAVLKRNNMLNNHKVGTDFAYKKLAQEFVAEIYSELWKEMNASIEVDSLFGGGFAEEMFRSNLVGLMVHKAYDDLSTPQSQAIYKSLKKKQELDEQESAAPSITEKS